MKNLFLLACCSLLLFGCDYQQRLTQIEEQLKATKDEIAALRTENETLKKAIADIETKRAWDELLRDLNKTAYLTPGRDGYSVIQYDLGSLTVKIADIKPYANGSKIILVFGNPLLVEIDGLSAKLAWGKVDDKGNPIDGNTKTKEINISQKLNGGCWTNIPIVLEGIPPSDLGFVNIKELSHKAILLNQTKGR